MMPQTFGHTDDPAEQAVKDEYVVWKQWADHCAASMELILFPDGPGWSEDARRIKAFRERAAQQ
jgi:hypothetical protein